MSILKKGTDFGPTEQVTSTKLDNLVDNASFTDTSGNSVPYTGSTGTCLNGGGLEVTSGGQLQIQDAGVGTSELSDTSVTTTKIASSAVTTAKIADANVTNAKLATDAVSTAKITDDAVTQAKIADDAVGAAQLASNAVVTASIVNANVTTAKIADDAVTPAKTSFLGTVDTTANSTTRIISKQSDGEYDSVTLSGDVTMTQAGAITIAGSAVTTSKIADANVTTAKIANANVTTAKIADSNVTTAKIADDAVTNAKIASTAVGTTELASSAVTTAKIANDAITSDKIADNAINSASMITGAVINTTNIVDDAVTTAKIANSSSKTTGVTFEKMQHISTSKILGRTTAGEGDVEEVSLLDEDNMSSDSATAVATQQSIKAYVDGGKINCLLTQTSSTLSIGSLPFSIPFDSEISDSTGMHSGSDAKITIGTAGVYIINATVETSNTNNGDFKISIFKGSSAIATILGDYSTTGAGQSFNITHTALLAASDEITVRIEALAGSSSSTSATINGPKTYFNATLVS